MSKNERDKYLDPKQNPWIPTGDDDGNRILPDDESPPTDPDSDLIPFWPEDQKKAAGADDLESKIKAETGKVSGLYDMIVCDGTDTACFKIRKKACGDIVVIDPDFTERSLADLTAEERKIVEANFGSVE